MRLTRHFSKGVGESIPVQTRCRDRRIPTSAVFCLEAKEAQKYSLQKCPYHKMSAQISRVQSFEAVDPIALSMKLVDSGPVTAGEIQLCEFQIALKRN
jgi:hypothetical protein